MAALRSLLAAAIVVGVLLFRPLTIASKQPPRAPLATRAGGITLPEHLPLDADAFAARLGEAVACATVSSDDENATDPAPFARLIALLRQWYPLVHSRLSVEHVPADAPMHSLLFTWKAARATAAPVILLSHLDVVPAEAREWSVPPFAGRVADGFVWGRGTMDDKAGVLAILHSLEYLLAQGVAPTRDVYVALGHDEEVGGARGAAKCAALLAARGVRAELLLDEGQPIVSGVIAGVRRPVALVGTGEKGSLTLELTARAPPGHSSMPPPTTAITELGRALSRVEELARPLSLQGPTAAMFEFLAPEMSFAFRVVTANLWLFGPLLKQLLARQPSTRAALQTTTAVTVMHGGVRHNVLPSEARAIVNHRLHPTDSVAAAAALDQAAAGERIAVRVLDALEPAPITSAAAPSFRLLQRTIAEVFPDAVSAPALMVGNTDTRWFWNVTDAIYRFCPLRLGPTDLGRYHGIDERVSVANLAEIADFYYRLLVNLHA